MEDAALVSRLQQGDEAAFDPLYRKYVDEAVRIAYLMTRNQQAAEDAVQEAFVQVLRRIGTLRTPAYFRTWFYRILHNSAVSLGRRGRRLLFLPWDLFRQEDRMDASEQAEEIVQAREETDEVRRALAKLPDMYRVPLILRYYAELTEPQIAEVLNLPVGTVKSRLYHARHKVSGYLEHPARLGGSVQ